MTSSGAALTGKGSTIVLGEPARLANGLESTSGRNGNINAASSIKQDRDNSESDSERINRSTLKRKVNEQGSTSKKLRFRPESAKEATKDSIDQKLAQLPESPQPKQEDIPPQSPSEASPSIDAESTVIEENGHGQDGQDEEPTGSAVLANKHRLKQANGVETNDSIKTATAENEDAELSESNQTQNHINPDEDVEDAEADAEEDEDEDAEDAERIRAIESLSKIEILFANFRNKLLDQQMARFDLEISMCEGGTHPELLAYHGSIKTLHDDRLERSRSHLDYQKQCIATSSRAMRIHILQTYAHNKFKLRANLLAKATASVYKLNSERRALERRQHTLPLMGPQIGPSSAAAAQASLLNYVGFPAAPSLNKVSEYEELDDFRQLGLR